MGKPYPLIEEIVRPNPRPCCKRAKGPVRRPVRKPARRNPGRKQDEVAMLGTLRSLKYTDAALGGKICEYRVPQGRVVLVGQTARKRLCFVYQPRLVAAARLSPVTLKNYREFNGFGVTEVCKGMVPVRFEGSRLAGEMTDIVYHSGKCIDPESCSGPADYHHRFKKPFPVLYVNPHKQIVVEGGGYHIERRGIID